MEKITVDCPKCGKQYEVDPGETVYCKEIIIVNGIETKCESTFTAPSQEFLITNELQ